MFNDPDSRETVAPTGDQVGCPECAPALPVRITYKFGNRYIEVPTPRDMPYVPGMQTEGEYVECPACLREYERDEYHDHYVAEYVLGEHLHPTN